MALTCPRCGTQNPDGNSFCQACGTPLQAAAPPPLMGPPPNIPPPTYQSPYYAAAAGMPYAPVHRTPWVLILSAVLGLVLVMAGCGTALALLNSRNANQASSSGLGSDLPSPSPAGTPSPVPSPSPIPTGPVKASTPTLSLTVPVGWQIANKDSESITLQSPEGDSVTVASGPSNPVQTAQQNKDTVDKVFTDHAPDAKLCPNTKVTAGSLNGASGIFWQLCFTLTSGSQSVQAGAPMFAGANSDGSVYYVVIELAPVSDKDNFITVARPVLASIQWQLK
jgi:hypothetical protein